MQKLTAIIVLILIVFVVVSVSKKIIRDTEVRESGFPGDVDGDVLRLLKKNGMDFTKTHHVDFEHIFDSESGAKKMSQKVESTFGYATSVGYNEFENSWDCKVVVEMLVTYDNIREMESKLCKIAQEFGGDSDGWGAGYTD